MRDVVTQVTADPLQNLASSEDSCAEDIPKVRQESIKHCQRYSAETSGRN